MYWIIRKALKWLSLISGQQCSGKRRSGYALEYCRYRAFHEGVCRTWNDEEFTDVKAVEEPEF